MAAHGSNSNNSSRAPFHPSPKGFYLILSTNNRLGSPSWNPYNSTASGGGVNRFYIPEHLLCNSKSVGQGGYWKEGDCPLNSPGPHFMKMLLGEG